MAGNPMGPPGLIKGTGYGLFKSHYYLLSTPLHKAALVLIVAVDMITGEILWKTPFGKIDKLSPLPIGLNGEHHTQEGYHYRRWRYIIGASADERFRAFDIDTGKKLLELKAPTSAMATPMTYMADGRQYVVIATGVICGIIPRHQR
jgi:quinoprotein glucose dehydrogenase